MPLLQRTKLPGRTTWSQYLWFSIVVINIAKLRTILPNAYINKSFMEALSGICPLLEKQYNIAFRDPKWTKTTSRLVDHPGLEENLGNILEITHKKSYGNHPNQIDFVLRYREEASTRTTSPENLHAMETSRDRLRQRITSLEDGIEGMSNEFMGFGKLVVDASRGSLAPWALCDLKKTTERFLKLACATEAVASDGDENGKEASSILSSAKEITSQEESVTELPSVSESCLAANLGFPMPFQFGTLLSSSSFTSTSTNQPRAPHPSPDDSGGFGLAGPRSFAMRLYKDTLTLMFSALTGETSVPGFIPRIRRFQFRHQKQMTSWTRFATRWHKCPLKSKT
ncbi:hypothetical protein BDZ45DRAFT_738962 [Acephala macrosclerotiorum]|nr:hypothetical protein BDZ45DRAFT_738962 [Acephala macrosclerotiorum]